MDISPNNNWSDLVSFAIYSNGVQINNSIQVTGIHVNHEVNTIGRALITLAPSEAMENLFELEHADFAEGNSIRIECGYDNSNAVVFHGFVHTQELVMASGDQLRLKVSCVTSDKNAYDANPATSSQPVLKVTYPDNVIAFNAKLNTDQATIVKWGTLLGEVSFQGSAIATPDTTIEIDGFSKRVNGLSYVSSVEHIIENGNWITTVSVGYDEQKYNDSVAFKSVSANEVKITSDETKRVVTLETVAGNKIELSDDLRSVKLSDQHNNRIEMSGDGISIESSGNLTFKAATGINIAANSDINISSVTGVKLKAALIQAIADMSFVAKGGTQAELSSGLQTTVKGAMVTIN
ncbi:hypothetical protein AMR72_03275 [Flavobacterium psychrophilum]|nr:hypothetical protein AMR72_03275 [Flavobacterium psychrophilum]AOE51615.1 hypothetical protein ALW18_03275 [Flavobacterium psychrophilum]